MPLLVIGYIKSLTESLRAFKKPPKYLLFHIVSYGVPVILFKRKQASIFYCLLCLQRVINNVINHFGNLYRRITIYRKTGWLTIRISFFIKKEICNTALLS